MIYNFSSYSTISNNGLIKEKYEKIKPRFSLKIKINKVIQERGVFRYAACFQYMLVLFVLMRLVIFRWILNYMTNIHHIYLSSQSFMSGIERNPISIRAELRMEINAKCAGMISVQLSL